MSDEIYKAGDVIYSDELTATVLEKCAEHLDRLIKENAALRAGLRKLEWKAAAYCRAHERQKDEQGVDRAFPIEQLQTCSACGVRRCCMGHAPDCWLAKLLEVE